MPVLRSGSAVLYGYAISTTGGWIDGSILIPATPNTWHAINTGPHQAPFGSKLAWTGPTLLDTTTEGTAIPTSNPPVGFTPKMLPTPPHVTFPPGSTGGGFFTGVQAGQSSGSANITPEFDLNSALWIRLISSIVFVTVDNYTGLTDAVISDNSSDAPSGSPRITFLYDIVAWWWTLPTAKDACGNLPGGPCGGVADGPLLLLAAGVAPPTGYQLLDPASPSTAAPVVVVNTVEPNIGAIAGGTSVTIHGSGFGNGCSVTFGGVAATSVVAVNQFIITCVTPSHAAGSGDVVVTNVDGTHN